MPDISLSEVSQSARDLFNKGFSAFERGNLDYAIHLLAQCVATEPRLVQARRFLRAAEVRRFKEKPVNFLTHAMAFLACLPTYAKARAKVAKGGGALELAEKLLYRDPLNIEFIKVFTQAAAAANLPEAAIQTLEIARDHYPNDVRIVSWLGSLYQKVGRTRSARECFERLCEITPNDPMALKALKDAMALDSMSSDGWEQAETYRDMIRDTREAEVLEQESKAVRSETDTESLIEEFKKKVAAEPMNLNYHRALGRLYAQKRSYGEALEILRRASELSPGDPELDAAVSAVRVQQMDHDIAALREAGDAAAAEALEAERRRFLEEDLRERVERYPNDLRLRYEWGVMLLNQGRLNEAIQQFQMSQRNPRFRVRSYYYLAVCFKRKGQYDLASEQLKRAASELAVMDETKKEIIYELGSIAEATGNRAEAASYYKQIYQVDIGYRDIADKVERVYRGN
ncbi:MAG: hypothetical protein FJ225_07655, partial [Lentisphaerae bacterium]|nr:hypothetical protein [Lentisphaerota bacterium]